MPFTMAAACPWVCPRMRPCPPPGKAHRYFFKVYALDTKLSLKSGATKSQLEAAMSGHILAQGDMIGKYGR